METLHVVTTWMQAQELSHATTEDFTATGADIDKPHSMTVGVAFFVACMTLALVSILLLFPAMTSGGSAPDCSLNVSSLHWEEASDRLYVDGLWLYEMEMSPDRRMVAATSYDRYLHIIELGPNLICKTFTFTSLNTMIVDAAWSPDGDFLAVSHVGEEIAIFETSTWTQIRTLEKNSTLRINSGTIGWGPDGLMMAVSYGDNIEIWNTSNWEVQYRKQVVHGNISRLEWSPDGTMLGLIHDYGFAVYSVEVDSILKYEGWDWRDEKHFSKMSWSPDGTYLAVTSGVSSNGLTYIYRCQDFQLVRTLEGYTDWYTHMSDACWSPDMRVFATGSYFPDGTVKKGLCLWDTRNFSIIQKFELDDSPGEIHWTDNLTSFVVGFHNMSIQMFHIPLANISRYVEPVHLTTGDTYQLTVNVSTLLPLDTVRFHFRYPGGAWEAAVMHDVLNDSYNVQLDAPHAIGTMEYYIEIVDIFNRTSRCASRVIPILDNDPPVFERDASDQVAAAGHVFRFKVDATDNIDIEMVEVTYWVGEAEPATLELAYDGVFFRVIKLPQVLSQLSYFITVVDTSGLETNSSTHARNIVDIDAPWIELAHQELASTGDSFSIEVSLTDNIMVEEAWIEWGVEETTRRQAIVLDGSPKSTVTILVPHQLGTLRFIGKVVDTSGNINSSELLGLPIVDNDIPSLLEDLTPKQAFTGEDLVLALRAEDNIGIVEAGVEFSLDGSAPTYKTMVYSSGSYAVTVQIPVDGFNIEYRFSLYDASRNDYTPGARVIPVEDIIPPSVTGSGNVSLLTGETFELYVKGSDNRGAVKVQFFLRPPGSGWTSREFAEGSEFDVKATNEELGISTEHFSGVIEFFIEVTDEDGNVGGHGTAGAPFAVVVLDVTPPVVRLVGPRECVVGQRVLYDASASRDDVGVRSVVWTVEGPEGLVWTGERVTASFTRAGDYRIRVEVTDTSGNVATADIGTEVLERPREAGSGGGLAAMVVLLVALAVAGAAYATRRDGRRPG